MISSFQDALEPWALLPATWASALSSDWPLWSVYRSLAASPGATLILLWQLPLSSMSTLLQWWDFSYWITRTAVNPIVPLCNRWELFTSWLKSWVVLWASVSWRLSLLLMSLIVLAIPLAFAQQCLPPWYLQCKRWLLNSCWPWFWSWFAAESGIHAMPNIMTPCHSDSVWRSLAWLSLE